MRSSTIWDYSQPQFYHFDEVTIWFAHLVVSQLARDRELRGIDLCSGCGVIGIEMMVQDPKLKMDFCDDHLAYEIHLKKNIKLANLSERVSNIFISSFLEISLDYDLVVMNPPFFLEGKHRQSPDANRNHARLLPNDFFQKLFLQLGKTVNRQQEIYILFPKDQRVLIESEATNFRITQMGSNSRYEALRLLHLDVE